jgi:hypothetical protein
VFNLKSSRFYLVLAVLLMLAPVILPGCGKPRPTTPAINPSATTPTFTTTARTAPPVKLTVLSISGGNVEVLKTGASGWKKGEEGMTLEMGDKIRTDTGGKALITFFDGSTVELQSDTAISLSELGINADQSTTVKIKQEVGKTLSTAKKLMDTGDRYEIETPAAVAAVRGTIMFVQVGLNGLTFVGNIEGSVLVTAQGKQVQLGANTHTNIVPGEVPGTPEPGATPPPTTTPPTTAPATTSTQTRTPTPTAKPTVTPTPTPVPTTSQPVPLSVRITSLKTGDLVERTIIVSGIVSDPSITEATLTLNGNSSIIGVNNGSFSASIALTDGVNQVVISVTRNGQTATDSAELVPEAR